MMLLAFVLAFIGFNLLCVNTGRNAQKIIDHPLSRWQQLLLSLCAWLALIASLWPLLTLDALPIALVNWAMLLTLAATCVVLLLSYRPHWLKLVALPLTRWSA